MLHPTVLQELLSKGFTLLPLRPNTKRPAVNWKHLIGLKLPYDLRVDIAKPLSRKPHAVLAGTPSGVTVLDFDGPPYLEGLPFVQTPSGGRHYYFRHKAHHRPALGINGHVDIPYVAVLYDKPVIIEDVELPYNGTGELPNRSGRKASPAADVTMEDFEECHFMRRFREVRDTPWPNRYVVARAYASNVIHAVDADTSLGAGYRHTEHIYQHVGLPIKCETIHQSAPCPHFQENTCNLCPGVASPYGLARRVHRRR